MPPQPQVPEARLQELIGWILGLKGQQPTEHQPSFSCMNAKSITERAICNDTELSRLDNELAQAFNGALKSADNVQQWKQSQLTWLRNVRDACQDGWHCLDQRYRERLAMLHRIQDAAGPWLTQEPQIPFSPKLLYFKDVENCNKALNLAVRSFRSRNPVPSVSPDTGNGDQPVPRGWRWLNWEVLEPPAGISSPDASPPYTGLFVLRLPMAGRDKPLVLVKLSEPHSWRGENHYAAVFNDPKSLEQAIPQATNNGQLDSHSLLKLGRLFYPTPAITIPEAGYSAGFSYWQDIHIAEHDGRYFFFDERHFFSRQSNNRIALFEIRPEGDIAPLCLVQILPSEDQHRSFLRSPGLRTYFDRLRTIGTGGVGACGTLNSNIRHDSRGEAALRRLGFRPWAVDVSTENSPYYKWGGGAEQFLQDWASDWDSWSQREYFSWREEYLTAQPALAKYYAKAFGLDQQLANKLAGTALHQATAAYLLIPESYESQSLKNGSEISLLDEYGQREAIHTYLKRSIADGTQATQIEAFIKQVTGKLGTRDLMRQAHTAATPAPPASPKESQCGYELLITDKGEIKRLKDGPPCPEPTVAVPPQETGPAFVLEVKEIKELLLGFWQLAIQHPHLIDMLLRHGLDVNVKNEFGKTMLMYAAQLNRPDVVRFLLRKGADPSSKTIPVDECGMVIKGERDALSYAVENAGIEVMRLLVEAGANVNYSDEEKLQAQAFLLNNPYLTTQQKSLSIAELIRDKQSIESDKPTYPCEEKLTPLEKLTCQTPSLARRDQELLVAFKAWEGNTAGPENRADKLASQRDWIKRRNKACDSKNNRDEIEGCMHIWTSARIRYLFGRVQDVPLAAPAINK